MKNIFRRSKQEKLKTNNCMKEVDIKIFKIVKEREKMVKEREKMVKEREG